MDIAKLQYIVFGIVILLALVFDLGLLSKKNTTITSPAARQLAPLLSLSDLTVATWPTGSSSNLSPTHTIPASICRLLPLEKELFCFFFLFFTLPDKPRPDTPATSPRPSTSVT